MSTRKDARVSAASINQSLVRDDAVEFCKQVLKKPDGTPFVPHEGQDALLWGIRRITVASCGWQWGKSVVMGAYIANYLATHANRRVFIIAPTLDQSRIIFNGVAAGSCRTRACRDAYGRTPPDRPRTLSSLSARL